VEFLKNDTATLILHSLYNVCFEAGKVPSTWSKHIITSILKSRNKDNLCLIELFPLLVLCLSYIAAFLMTELLNGPVMLIAEQKGRLWPVG
jgi:hypothetical protein